jgi:hypothetical protein
MKGNTIIYISGLVFLVTGSLLIGLSGIEKVILYYSIFTQYHVISMDAILLNIPSYMWRMTNYTLWFGLTLILISILSFIYGKYKKYQ